MNNINRNKRFGKKFKKSGSGGHYGKSSYGTRKTKKMTTVQKLIHHNYHRYSNNLNLHQRTFSEKVVLLGLSTISAFLIVLILVVGATSLTLPSVKKLDELMNAESTVFYDKDGQVLYTVYADENRETVDSDKIPDMLKNATISIEDDRFYKHNGFDVGGIFKAVLSEFGIGSPRGGSTITQQFVKNSFLTNEHTYTRKIKEVILSVRLEKKFTKDQILTMYLNKIPYGGTAYGVQRASETFFNKNVEDLTLAESAVLAALPKAPTFYSPYGQHKHTRIEKEFSEKELKKRKIKNIGDLLDAEYSYGLIGQNHTFSDDSTIYLPGRIDEVLKRMEDFHYISEEDKMAARVESQKLEFQPPSSSIKAPHFVFYVKEQLEKKYGKDVVETGGLKVYTSLDSTLQAQAETMVSEQALYNTNNYGAENMALVSMNAKTGEILAMVGSADYFNADIDGAVNMATARRQPGSSFKPLVYAAAMLEGYGAGNVLYDVSTSFGSDRPNNYDGGFRGPMTIRKALGQSRNIPAIKAYFLAGEQEKIMELAERMGISTLDPNVDYGWPLSLGTGEVKMVDMIEAFGTFANVGTHVHAKSILKVKDSKGKVLEDNTEDVEKEEDALDPQVAYIISDILSDSKVHLGPRLSIPGRRAGAKTGTSNKKISSTKILPSNLWTIGFTPQIVTAVWAGNSDGEAMYASATGYQAAAPVWQKFMIKAHEDLPIEWQDKPKGVSYVKINKLSGKLPGKFTPDNVIVSDLFPSFGIPKLADTSLVKVEVDERNNKLPNEYCPEEFVKEVVFWNPQSIKPGFLNWDGAVKAWYNSLDEEKLAKLNLGENIVTGSMIEEESELCSKELSENVPIIDLSDYEGDTYPRQNLTVQPRYETPVGLSKVEFYLGDSLQYTATEEPFKGDVRITPIFRVGSSLTINVKAYDVNGYFGENDVQIFIGDEYKDADDPEDEDIEEPPVEDDLIDEIPVDVPEEDEDVEEPPVEDDAIPAEPPVDEGIPSDLDIVIE